MKYKIFIWNVSLWYNKCGIEIPRIILHKKTFIAFLLIPRLFHDYVSVYKAVYKCLKKNQSSDQPSLMLP